MPFDLLIVNGTVLRNQNGTADPGAPGFVAISGPEIAAIGRMSELPSASATRVIDAAGRLVMPGLINCHTHAAMTLFRGLADDLPLPEWLQDHIFPAEARHVDPEMVYWCTKLAAAEMIMSGTTTAADGYFYEDCAARAFADAGLRAVAAQGVIDFPAPGVPDPAGNITVAQEFLHRWRHRHPLIVPAVFCHSLYTCGPETLRAAKALARREGVPFFIHVAETRNEVETCRAERGKTPIRLLAELDLLDRSTVCVHAIWLSDDDIGLLAAAGAAVVHCPESNMKLAAGIMPLAALAKQETIALGLGTDGCASNNDLDLFREIGSCARLHGVAGNGAALAASLPFSMATSGGARVLGMQEEIGCLAPGRKADIIVVDPGRGSAAPCRRPARAPQNMTGAGVVSSIIDGRVVMQGRRIETFSVREVYERVEELSKGVKSSAGSPGPRAA